MVRLFDDIGAWLRGDSLPPSYTWIRRSELEKLTTQAAKAIDLEQLAAQRLAAWTEAQRVAREWETQANNDLTEGNTARRQRDAFREALTTARDEQQELSRERDGLLKRLADSEATYLKLQGYLNTTSYTGSPPTLKPYSQQDVDRAVQIFTGLPSDRIEMRCAEIYRVPSVEDLHRFARALNPTPQPWAADLHTCANFTDDVIVRAHAWANGMPVGYLQLMLPSSRLHRLPIGVAYNPDGSLVAGTMEPLNNYYVHGEHPREREFDTALDRQWIPIKVEV